MKRYKDIVSEVQNLINNDEIHKLSRHKVTFTEIKNFSPEEIISIREKANMTQYIFAMCLGVSVKTVRNWENGYRTPNGSARRLISLFQDNPNFAADNNIYIRTVDN